MIMGKLKTRSLVIVESPTKARTISRFLPENFEVEASMGHVRDLPASAAEIPTAVKKETWSRLGVNIGNNFHIMVVASSEPQLRLNKVMIDVTRQPRFVLPPTIQQIKIGRGL